MKKQTDERIKREQEKLNAKAFGLALLGLWILISIRLFILKQDPMDFIDIFALTMILSVYVLFGTIQKGNYQSNPNNQISKTTIFLGGSVGTIVFALVQLFLVKVDLGSQEEILSFLVSIVLFWFVWVGLQYLFTVLSKKQASKDLED